MTSTQSPDTSALLNLGNWKPRKLLSAKTPKAVKRVTRRWGSGYASRLSYRSWVRVYRLYQETK